MKFVYGSMIPVIFICIGETLSAGFMINYSFYDTSDLRGLKNTRICCARLTNINSITDVIADIVFLLIAHLRNTVIDAQTRL